MRLLIRLEALHLVRVNELLPKDTISVKILLLWMYVMKVVRNAAIVGISELI
jgi:hypothetical protein